MMKKRLVLLLISLAWAMGCAQAATTPAPTPPPETAVPEPTEISVEETAVPDPTEAPVEPASDPDEEAASLEIDPILALEEGWTKITPGGETRCAHDTEFAFWVRPGNINRLLVYFQGGGGCWNGDTCQVGSSFYDDVVTNRDTPNGRGGILDFNNPLNPFADYHAVYVPSCTGDIYLGSNVQTYETSSGENIDIYHHGFINLNAALEWAYEHVLGPESIFVTGCSAGSIGSIRAAPHLIHHYSDSEVIQLGDSLGFLFSQPAAIDQIYGSHQSLPDWIPEFASFDPNGFTMTDFYNTVAATYPDYRFAQYNTELDRVQVRYHLAGGETADSFAPALAGAISAIHAQSPNFRSYMADGDVHCIMPGGSFYSREVNGVSFRDWVADLATGADVPNVQCDACGVDFGAGKATLEPEWEQVGTMQTPRSENRGVVINGRFYIPGGWGGETTFEAYDPTSATWETLADLPEGRHHFMVASYEDRLYLFGGSPPNAYRPTQTAWVYDPANDQWQPIAELPTPRLAGAAVTLDDAIYLVGGAANGAPTPTLRYSPADNRWTELAPPNQVGEHVAAVGHENKIFLFGGWAQPGQELARLEIYDVTSDSWSSGGNMQITRGGLAAALLDGRIYAVGGERLSNGQTQTEVEVYDLASGEWTTGPALPAGIHGFPLLVHEGALWLIGGSDRAGAAHNEGRILRLQPN